MLTLISMNLLRLGRLSLLAFFGVVLVATTPTARAQASGDPSSDSDAGIVMDGDSFAGADMGFATGETSPNAVPFQPAPLPPDEAAPAPAPSSLYGRWTQLKADLDKKTGTTFELYLNPSDQVIIDGPARGTNRAVAWYNFHLGQKLWPGAQALMNVRGGDGQGLNRYGDSLFNFNQHAGEENWGYVSHLFLQQKLFAEKLTVSVGKLDLLDFFDDNEVAGWNLIPYSLARNPSIPAPFHAIGAVGRVDATPWLYLQVGAADAAGNAHQTGLNTAFDSGEPYFTMFEVGVKPKLFGRPGTYRAIFWHNEADVARFDGTGAKSNDNGVGLSFDQQITDRFSLFARYGYSDPSVRRMQHYVSLGASLSEPIPGRKADVLGVEVAEVVLSRSYRVASGVAATATQFDAYYKIAIFPWLAVTPDVQLILNPDRGQGKNTLFIAGAYAEMRF